MLSCGFHRAGSIMFPSSYNFYLADSIVWIPSCKFYTADSIVRNPLCEFDRAPLWSSLRRSQCTILWCGFHRVDCIVRIPSWEFHRAGSIVRVPLYKIHAKLYCANATVRIPLCASRCVHSIMCLPTCAFHRAIPSYAFHCMYSIVQ